MPGVQITGRINSCYGSSPPVTVLLMLQKNIPFIKFRMYTILKNTILLIQTFYIPGRGYN